MYGFTLQVDDFFTSAKSDDKLAAELDKEQTVFFVYLPGIDTNGHRYNPISNETRANIQLVDKGDTLRHLYMDLRCNFIW